MTTKAEPKDWEIEDKIADLKRELSEIRRRAAPETVKDYVFDSYEGEGVRLTDAFRGRSELIVIHNMGAQCAYCTLWADGFNGVLPHLESRAAFVVVSPDDPQTQRNLATSRGWRFRMLSCRNNTFAEDMGFVHPTEGYWPGVSGFAIDKRGTVVRTGKSTFGPGDNFCAVWHLFDLLPNGANGWEPQLSYSCNG